MKQSVRFRNLAIGQIFDFIQEGSIYNSFYEPCRKISARGYVAIKDDGSVNERYGRMRVGSINANVYHVKEVK